MTFINTRKLYFTELLNLVNKVNKKDLRTFNLDDNKDLNYNQQTVKTISRLYLLGQPSYAMHFSQEQFLNHVDLALFEICHTPVVEELLHMIHTLQSKESACYKPTLSNMQQRSLETVKSFATSFVTLLGMVYLDEICCNVGVVFYLAV